MEMLIVIAIIAILIAIAIPIFTSQLEQSRDSVSISNIRSAYAEASAAMMTSNGAAVSEKNNVTVAAVSSDKQKVTVKNVEFKGQVSGFSDLDKELSFNNKLGSDDAATGGVPGTYTLEFEFDLNAGTCTLNTPTTS